MTMGRIEYRDRGGGRCCRTICWQAGRLSQSEHKHPVKIVIGMAGSSSRVLPTRAARWWRRLGKPSVAQARSSHSTNTSPGVPRPSYRRGRSRAQVDAVAVVRKLAAIIWYPVNGKAYAWE
jgi:hypothetical protein